MKKYYAGIGARATPQPVLERITRIGCFLAEQGWLLRSGGAIGADSAFAQLRPYRHIGDEIFRAIDCTQEAKEVASKYHPNWSACTEYVQKLHGRNAMILLGRDLQTPVEFVVCWTAGGKVVGGTGLGLRIADAYGIPIFNLWDENNYRRLYSYVRS